MDDNDVKAGCVLTGTDVFGVICLWHNRRDVMENKDLKQK